MQYNSEVETKAVKQNYDDLEDESVAIYIEGHEITEEIIEEEFHEVENVILQYNSEVETQAVEQNYDDLEDESVAIYIEGIEST